MLFVLLGAFVIILAWFAFGIYEPAVVTTHAPIVRDPIEILNQRYMTGEITKPEYDRIRRGMSTP